VYAKGRESLPASTTGVKPDGEAGASRTTKQDSRGLDRLLGGATRNSELETRNFRSCALKTADGKRRPRKDNGVSSANALGSLIVLRE